MFKYLNKEISTPVAFSIILILAIIVGIFTFWQYSEIQKEKAELAEIKIPDKTVVIEEEKEKETTSTQPQESTSTEETTFPEEIDTSGWKTYSNEKYGFEVKYPSVWQYEEEKMSVGDRVTFYKEPSDPTYFEIGINLKGDFPSAEAQCTESKEIEIAGIKTRKTNHWAYASFSSFQELTPVQCEKDPSLTNIYARIEKDGNVYEFVFFCKIKGWKGKEGREKCNHLYDQILSTFRFVN